MLFLVRRLFLYFLAFIVAATLNFILPRFMPGDPVDVILANAGDSLTFEAETALREALGFTQDSSLIEQYFQYIGNVLDFNFGVSIKFFPAPVWDILSPALGWTVFLAGTATLLSFSIGSFLGIISAWRRGTRFDSVVTLTGVILHAIPPVIIALLSLLLFSVILQWFPTGRAYDLYLDPEWSWEFIGSLAYHAVLPIGSLVLYQYGAYLLPMRNSMINLLGEDFIALGRAKGLGEKRVMMRYGARNALLPAITALSMAIGFVLGGSLVTEMIFNYPGVGNTLFQAIKARDYPLIQGVLLLVTMTILVANFIADLLYVVFDPRVRTGGAQ
ncbi:ABC transporter permease [Vibrio sp. DW001]|uniref:ABC transporter permease n=1 Tax=Vibrio sp. DW001 TaxID=2912315 RepID=UPI0023AF9418|nr:ABC transporter permease [Vibrio sp. DW001]WED27833.1 ABC transporter permease [Vibrio sp. DW001]